MKFSVGSKGKSRVIKQWGIDTTWVNYYNARASSKNAGEQIDFIRIGFYLHEQTNRDGSLSKGQTEKLEAALKYVDIVNEKLNDNASDKTEDKAENKMPLMLSPCNTEGIIDWYKNPNGTARVDRWFNVMLKTKEYLESKDHKVVSVEVFNEPDWHKWNMGKKADLNHLFKMCKAPEIQRIGPSTLSTQPSMNWYQNVRANVEVASTHTLGGTMAQYVDFIRKAKRDRKQFMNPEVHALVEVIVGAEEGQRGYQKRIEAKIRSRIPPPTLDRKVQINQRFNPKGNKSHNCFDFENKPIMIGDLLQKFTD